MAIPSLGFSPLSHPTCSSSLPPFASESSTKLNTSTSTFCVEAFAKLADNNQRIIHVNRLDRVRAVPHCHEVNTNEAINHDVSSARGWMEDIEQCEGSAHGVGAYTVIRCDAIFSAGSADADCEWKLWGLDFHMERLHSSYSMLTLSNDSSIDLQFNLEEAIDETNTMLTRLLGEARGSLYQNDDSTTQSQQSKDKLTRTLMLTILWSQPPILNDNNSGIHSNPIIRGHAAFAGASRLCSTTMEDDISPPITTCLAIPKEPTLEALDLLPCRYSSNANQHSELISASAKISSWCRIRRPLEDPTIFKVPGMNVREVLLVQHCNSHATFDESNDDFVKSLDILEGLTSNLFVIYKDKTIRTASEGTVLSGYARYLIVNELRTNSELGIVLDDTRPPTVQDAIDGLWSEVFVTSAIRLIIPVERVLIPSIDDEVKTISDMTTLWQTEDATHPFARALRSALFESDTYASVLKN